MNILMIIELDDYEEPEEAKEGEVEQEPTLYKRFINECSIIT